MSITDRIKYGRTTYRLKKIQLTKSSETRSRLQCYVLIASKSIEAKVIVRS